MSRAVSPDTPSESALRAIGRGEHSTPHSVLGPHKLASGGQVIRVRRPLAESVTIVRQNGTRLEAAHIGHGIWQCRPRGIAQPYLIEARYHDGEVWTEDDPYRFAPSIGDVDLYLLGEGRHENLWQVLGANAREHEGELGVSFAVWAPRAKAIRVVGGFNSWDGSGHQLRRLDGNGVWEIFIPGIAEGETYKFEILTGHGNWVLKADPIAKFAEVPAATASRIFKSNFQWQDADWLEHRTQAPHSAPLSIYEVHLGSWKPGLDYRSAAPELASYVRKMGFTHVEFLPLAEHPFGGSWGYQVTGYFAPTSRFGNPDDFRFLIDTLHRAGIGVILDWVPAHFPKDEWALARFDGEPLYEYADPRLAEHPDWGTLVFDFGKPQVRNFLVANALYWLEEFHIDGLRVDAVASMLYLDYSRAPGQWQPNRFGGRENLEAIDLLKEVTATAYKLHPSAMIIAEESTAFPGVTSRTDSGGLGFGFKWNMGWMHDSLDYFSYDPLFRSHHHSQLTHSLSFAFSENYVLPVSHDEVVHGKGSLLSRMPGDHWKKLANLRAFLAYQWSYPGKKLLFMGQEFGQSAEWSQQRGLDWWTLEQPSHEALQRFAAELNRLYRETPALWSRDSDPSGFEWIDRDSPNADSLAFLRWPKSGAPVAVAMNLSGVPIDSYSLPLPEPGQWKELLNSDATEFGGSGSGNLGAINSIPNSESGFGAAASITLPALSVLWFTPAS
ncbi:MAG: 1,4-alpha-glucan branching protein GlgB [Microbacteriaceae bacterium]|nr:1,4-alpha-glucan branching protein GlgB [Microbacteriaceae bacterium]